jgi:hypothetical protein
MIISAILISFSIDVVSHQRSKKPSHEVAGIALRTGERDRRLAQIQDYAVVDAPAVKAERLFVVEE